jgi:3-methylfumaryl-CoA hydratase
MVEVGNWTAHTVVTHELLDPSPVAGLASLLDDGLPAPVEGEELPPLWHWVALPRWVASGVLGTDGHPRRGGFLPPIELPRRMFAGGNLTFCKPLIVGDMVRRESEVVSITEKDGRSGPIVIVDVATRLFDRLGELAVAEVQNLVYREQTATPTSADLSEPLAAESAPGSPFHQASDDEWEFRTDPSLLARFSAVTANAHRIHYDWPYATRVEGYPGLVVHGPLQSIALAEIHRLSPGAQVRFLRHRGNAPLFCGQRASLRATYNAAGGALLELTTPHEGSSGPNATVELMTTGNIS